MFYVAVRANASDTRQSVWNEEGCHNRNEKKKNDKGTEMKTMLKNIIYVGNEHEHEQDSCVK